MFSLSTFQSKGNNQNFFHQRNFQKVPPPIQSLMDEFKTVVFKKVEMEYQDMSTIIELLPNLVDQDSKSDLKDKFHDF